MKGFTLLLILGSLKGHPKSPDKVDHEIIPDLQARPKRQAAEMAKDKIKQMADQLHLQAILKFNPYKFNTVKSLEEMINPP